MYLMLVPDENTPISETTDGIQELYVAGKFDKFGLCNFSADEVKSATTTPNQNPTSFPQSTRVSTVSFLAQIKSISSLPLAV